MPFDFKDRALRREQKEAQDRARLEAARERREALADELARTFAVYARDDLYRHQLFANRRGASVEFHDGSKTARVTVVDPSTYDVHFSTVQLDGDPPGEDRRARCTSDDDLMDALTAWALNRR